MDRGRLVVQDELGTLRAPTGRVGGRHAGAGPGGRRCWTAGWSDRDGSF